MVDPLDLDALQAIREICPELRIKPILCNWEHFEHVAKKLLREESSGGGPQEISAASLGFSAQPAAAPVAVPVPPPQAPAQDDSALRSAVDHLIQQATFQADAKEQKTSAGVAPEAVAQMLQQGVRDAMHEVRDALNAVAQRPHETAPPGMSASDLASALKEALRETMPAVLPSAPPANAAAPAFDPQALAVLLRESIAGAMQEGLAQIAAQGGAHAPQQHAAPPPEIFAEVIRDSVGGAMQEAMATLLVQLRSLTGRRDNDTHELANALRQSVTEIQGAQEQRLSELAEATRHSVEHLSALFEQGHVHQQTLGDLQQKKKQVGHVSVTPFGPGNPAPSEEYAAADAKLVDAMISDNPNEAFTFDGFLPGKVNAFTFKLSQAVAQAPGGEYNPYFLYGEVGTGKTHLISAIGNGILRNNLKARVGYVSASYFARRLAEATQANNIDAFRENYCHWDVLILDDIQFMGGRVEAQEEFFHIFNVLRQEGRQIIIASDKAPDRLGLLEKRLVSRFSSGIVAHLKAPEMETRLQILHQVCASAGVQVPPEVLSIVAMRVPNDVRKMTGSLRKIVAYAKLVGQDMSCELAEEILSHLASEEAA
jgi:chromosomal replication initiator protein DnaA